MSDRRNNERGGRGHGRGHGKGRGQQNNRRRNNFKNKEENKKEETNRKELSFFAKEYKEKKEFKIGLGGNDTEKVLVPCYGDDDQDETLLILVKDFNLLIEDGDLLEEEEIGSEELDRPFTVANNRRKLVAIKEVYRKFRSCLKGEAREVWLKLVEDQPILAIDNYVIDNTFGVENFYDNQKELAKTLLDDDAVEDLKTFLQSSKKPRRMRIDNYIRRIKVLNNYIPLMENGAIKLTERELIKQVILKNVPVSWNLALKRANNHKSTSLSDLQRILKPIEEADEVERKWKESNKSRNGKDNEHKRGNPNNNNNNNSKNANDKPCRKPGHNHLWGDCPDNRNGRNPRNRNENNNIEQSRDNSREREVRFEDEHEENNIMEYDESMYDDTDRSVTPRFELESEDEDEAQDAYLLRNKPSKVHQNTNKKARASVIFSLEDKNGKKEEFLGLLDTGSTGGLISQELVTKYDFKCKQNNSTWDTNAGNS